MGTEVRRNRMEQLEILLARVIVMRDFQRSYFATRSRENLNEAKLSEARVDVLIRELSSERHGLFG